MTNNILDDNDLKEMGVIRVKHPSLWNVVFQNDNYTEFEFVIFVLQKIFHKTLQDAEVLAFQIHIEGKGIAGTYSFEVAETKQAITMDMAKAEHHPLLVVLQEII